MKPRWSNKRNAALTLVEVLIVSLVFVCFIVLVLTGLVDSRSKAQRINCMSNLKEIGIAFRLWESNRSDKDPTDSVTNGDMIASMTPGKAYVLWQTLSNRLGFPKIVWCPADAKTEPANNFSIGFNDANISYFVAPDASEAYPQMILDGDDNLLVDGKPVQPGVLNLETNQIIAWTKDRHHSVGNIGMADGSAAQVTTHGLQEALQQTGIATNHLVLP